MLQNLLLIAAFLFTASAHADTFGSQQAPVANGQQVPTVSEIEAKIQEWRGTKASPQKTKVATDANAQSQQVQYQSQYNWPETSYEQINTLATKLMAQDGYIGDGRDKLRGTCTRAADCQNWYALLQNESAWLDAVKAGYASKGCEPNRNGKALVSDDDGIYYVAKDEQLAKDEIKYASKAYSLDALKNNKRILKQNDYASEVCGAYAKDIWQGSRNSNPKVRIEKLRIQKVEY